MKTFLVLGRLLDYPSAELVAALPEMKRVLAAEQALPPAQLARLDTLLAELAARDLVDLQADYTALFDRMRSLSLHLFEHAHGDERTRGQAMANLVELYREHGLDVTARELPDYLPLVLEFFSLLPPETARGNLADAAAVLAVLQARLAKRANRYAPIFEALLALAGKGTAVAVEDDTTQEDSPEALDRAWEEAAVTFGAEPPKASESCTRAATMVARMQSPPRSGGAHADRASGRAPRGEAAATPRGADR